MTKQRLTVESLLIATATALVSPQAAARTAVVRLTSVDAVSPAWVDFEDAVVGHLTNGDDIPVSPSEAAVSWRAPGYERDIARLTVIAHLQRAAERISDASRARPELAKVTGLIRSAGVLGILSGHSLRTYHELMAQLEAATQRGRRHRDALAGLLGGPKAATAGSAGITVSAPRGAAIYLDEKLIGYESVRSYNIAPGPHYLRAGRAGCAAYGRAVNLSSSEIARLEVVLTSCQDGLADLASLARSDDDSEELLGRLNELAESVGATEVLLLIPGPEDETVMMRRFVPGEARLDAPVSTPLAFADLAMSVDRALGRGTPVVKKVVARPVEPAITLTPLPVDDVEVEERPGRWLWMAGGAAVIAGVIVGIIAGSGDSEPSQSRVWVCPTGSSCAH